jgi:Zn-dependent peptidase ImmA (M78 family)
MTGIRNIKAERQFNHEMFALARKVQGLTQTELHIQSGISQAHLSKIEQGIQMPTEEHIEKFSSTLGFPIEFFFQINRYFPPITPFHRKRTSLGKKAQEQAEAIANLKRIHLEKLLVGFEINKTIPRLDMEDYGTPEKIAQAIRAYLNLPKGPVYNLVEILEDYGVFVFLEEFISMQLAGFTLIGNDTTPVIFVNKESPGDAERMTIAHELGHIVMHTIINEKVEEEAWRFAVEFLMPKADIISDLRKAQKIADFADLKRKWRISMMALMRRSHELNFITDMHYRFLMQGMSKYRVVEPVQIPQETPALFDELISQYKTEYNYSDAEILQLLTISKEMYNDLYVKNNNIRIVK